MKSDRFMSFGGDVRSAGEWRFEGGAFVQILIGGEVTTFDALEMVDVLVKLKREELSRLLDSKGQTLEPASAIPNGERDHG